MVGVAIPCIGHSILAVLWPRISEPGVHGSGLCQGPRRLHFLPLPITAQQTGHPTPAFHVYSTALEDMDRPKGTSLLHHLGLQPVVCHPTLSRAPPVGKHSLWVVVGQGEGPQLLLIFPGSLEAESQVGIEWKEVKRHVPPTHVSFICASSNPFFLSFTGHEPGK